MTEYELFSRRQERLARAGQPIIYQYDALPRPFRNQVKYIWRDAIGPHHGDFWRAVYESIARDLGEAPLDEHARDYANYYAQCLKYLDTDGPTTALDVIELSFRILDRVVRNMADYVIGQAGGVRDQSADEAIAELNARFQEHAVGYQYLDGFLVRIDSQYMHAEVVEPALALLHDAGFTGPSEEFLRGHEHYRHGRNKEALVAALGAFESTMKAICDARGWAYPAGAPASKLIKAMLDNELIPASLQNQVSQLASFLEGVATVRNKMGGHGQGSRPVPTEPHFVEYALNLSAANIVLLVKAHRAKPS